MLRYIKCKQTESLQNNKNQKVKQWWREESIRAKGFVPKRFAGCFHKSDTV